MSHTPPIPTCSPFSRIRLARAAARVSLVVLTLGALGVLAAGCGKKGPPLPPLTKLPMPPTDVAVRRAGDTVYVRFTVPTQNADRTVPADIARLEVYAYTALREVELLDVKGLTLVGEVLVRTPVDPGEEREARENPGKKKTAKPRPVEPGVEQGTSVTVTEALTPATRELTKFPKSRDLPPVAAPEESPWSTTLSLAAVGPVPELRPRRFYVVYAVNRRGVRSTASARFAVAFDVQPPPPGRPTIAVKASTAEISWNPPAGAAEPLSPTVADPQLLPSASRGLVLPVLPLYNVYVVERDASSPAAAGAPAALPVPLNDKPLSTPSFVDTQIAYGTERCYQVRTVNAAGALALLPPAAGTPTTATATAGATPALAESDPSPIACITPADTEPPPAPTSLAAIASTGAISLIWNAVDVSDLAGYIVLRSQGAQGAMVPLFTTPIRETTYRDTDVKPGVRYAYTVVAVDTAKPPNQSPPSNRVEDTAR